MAKKSAPSNLTTPKARPAGPSGDSDFDLPNISPDIRIESLSVNVFITARLPAGSLSRALWVYIGSLYGRKVSAKWGSPPKLTPPH